MKGIYHQLLFVFLLLGVAAPSFAQSSVTISGKITDSETQEGLAGVNIGIKGTVLGTISGTQGEFSLKARVQYPVTLIASFVGYKSQEIVVASADAPVALQLVPGALLGEEVVVTASRVEESILKSPVAVEKLDLRALKETPAASFYDAIEAVKGVQMTTLSLGFKVPNTRGFVNTTNARFLQMVDGADTQAPGLGGIHSQYGWADRTGYRKYRSYTRCVVCAVWPQCAQRNLELNNKKPIYISGFECIPKGWGKPRGQ